MALELTKSSKGTEQPSLALSEIWLAKLMDETLSNWPNQTIPQSTARMWLGLWREMAEEHGAEKFQKTLWKLCKTAKWCPVPGEIAEALRQPSEIRENWRAYLPAEKLLPPPAEERVSPKDYAEFKSKVAQVLEGKKL